MEAQSERSFFSLEPRRQVRHRRCNYESLDRQVRSLILNWDSEGGGDRSAGNRILLAYRVLWTLLKVSLLLIAPHMGSGLVWLRGDCPANGERMDFMGRIRRGFVRACTVINRRDTWCFRGSGRIRVTVCPGLNPNCC